MVVNLVTVHVKPDFSAGCIAAALDNHKRTRTEPGNPRFEPPMAHSHQPIALLDSDPW